MVQVNRGMLDPTVARADYSQLTNAVIRGKDQELIASKEKNARIRASLAEVEMNNRTSNDAQAAWMGAIDQNQDLLNALNNAPPRIQKAYQKATQGRATLEDNSVISSYLGSIQKQMTAEQQSKSGGLQNKLIEAQIAQSEAGALRQTSDMNLANAELEALQNPGANPRQATINALMGNQQAPAQSMQGGGGTRVPPVAAINASDPSDPVNRPVTGLALPEPAPIPTAPTGQSLVDNNPFAPQAPAAAAQAPVAAPGSTPEVDPNAPFFTDSKGNRVVASPQAMNSPEVAKQVADGVSEGTAIQRVQAGIDLKRKLNEYVNGDGNFENLPTADSYTAQLYAAGNDLDDAREQTEAAIAQGVVFAGPTSKEKATLKKEFRESYNKETSGLSALLADTQIVQSAADRVKSNAGFFTSGAIPSWAAAIGLDLMPVDGKSSIEMKKAISQLTSSSALSTMQTLKDNSKQGATGLGQVAVKEFEALMDKASSIDQYLQSGDLEDAVNLYVYDRNKLAYKTYASMVESYGVSAVNSQGGISERQISTILRDINDFEKLNGISISPKKEFNIIKLWYRENVKSLETVITGYEKYVTNTNSRIKTHF